MSDHQKCQYCTDERNCMILREECLMDNPDELKCKEMYNIPCDNEDEIIKHSISETEEAVYYSEEEISDEVYDY